MVILGHTNSAFVTKKFNLFCFPQLKAKMKAAKKEGQKVREAAKDLSTATTTTTATTTAATTTTTTTTGSKDNVVVAS